MSDYNPDIDPRSSNSLIRAYLASKQMQPGNPNFAQAVRTALSANAASPGTIPGLVNSTPSTEADDQAAMAAARGRHGIGGNSRGAGLPTPPVPPVGPPPPGSGGGAGGGSSGGGGESESTSAPPPGGGGLSDDEITNAMLAAAIGSGGGAATLLMKRALANRKPATPAVPHVTGVEGPGGQLELPLQGGKGTAPPSQPELPLQGGGPRVNQPELPLVGGGGPAQPDLFGPRAAPAPAAAPVPPITVQAQPSVTIPAPDPAVVPAQPQITDTVPAIDEAGARVKKPGRARASRARVPARL